MLFSLFIIPSLSALVGVDIGSEYLRASILRSGKSIEILLDANSKRTFSTIMTVIPTKNPIVDCINITEVDDYEYVMNDPLSIRKYPNSTIHHWSNFIAKLSNSEIKNLSIQRHFYAPITGHFNDRVLVSGVFPEVVFHRSLPLINDSALALDSNAVIKSSVFAVPKFWPQQERDAIRSIARNLKFSPFIVDSSRAVATYFALEHQKHFSSKPLKVAFFDFGASNVQITISQFIRRPRLQITELAYAFDDQIGGRDIDVLIFELLLEKFTANQQSLTPKAEQMLLLESNKIKHRLTTDNVVAGYIEEFDFNYQIPRAEFEKAMEPILANLTQLIQDVISEQQVERVQMLGGSSRIPCVQNAVKDAFDVEKLMFSMNAEESSAIGAAYVGAGKSSDFILPKIEYIPLELFNLSVTVNNTKYPFNETILMPGKPHWISNNVTGKKYPVGSSIYLAWSNTNETTKIIKTKDGLWRFKNGTQHQTHPWKSQTLNIASEIEKKEAAKTLLEETVNKLEKLLFDTKMALNEESKLQQMTTENERKALSVAVSVTDRWFLKQQTFEQETIEKRLNMLEDAVGSVMCRVQNDELLPEAEKNMSKLIKNIEKTITKNWIYKDEKRRPKRRSIRNLLRMITEYQIWHDELAEIQKELKPTDTPALLWNEIRDKTKEISRVFEDMKDRAMGRTNSGQQNENVYVYPPSSANVQIK
ncbi:hypothetical protein TRFO_28073 [Tritrichomonas foetus]|uniref:DnaK protein n=1 Tax=Tritrichomonas foetus TaxID=1144522 RepID=A0A1J4K0S1_9EUKA|nr:hypothetical protein TRFO_28073 [Tritrichomonas foetus]|eukprot:OHT04376.1 hypothetical protein TRFO_28073 [Tritrichomonas foetus]